MVINRIFELTMMLDSEHFQQVLDNAISKSEHMEERDGEYIDFSFNSKGILVIYRDSQYKKKIRILINTNFILNDGAPDLDKFIRKLRKHIEEYFGSEYSINDFVLTGVTLATDIDVGSREKVSSYIRVLKRIRRVKGFSPVSYDSLDSTASFCLSGNSNGIDFLLYGLEHALSGSYHTANAKHKDRKAAKKHTPGILRAEIKITKPKAIRRYTDVSDVSGQITAMIENSTGIFMDIFTRIVPFGDFYKKDRAAEILRRKVKDEVMKKRMLRLLALIPEKKSLYLAQKAMNCRDVEKVMEAFAKINLSPVTIGKRQDGNRLNSLFDFFV